MMELGKISITLDAWITEFEISVLMFWEKREITAARRYAQRTGKLLWVEQL